MNTLDVYDINLEMCPPKHHLKITQFTMGDLHANAIKLIYTLVRNGVCDISHKQYRELVTLYKKPALTKATRLKFDEIIDNHLAVINNMIVVRLLGDSLADRGQNDWFVLKILDKLQNSGVQVRMTMSNHDAIFLQAIGLNGEIAKSEVPLGADSGGSLGRSYIALYHSMVEQIVSKTEVDALVKKAYLPTLVLIDYSLSEGHLSLFSHAPIDFQTIESLANQLDISYDGPAVNGLVNTIKAINQKFSHAIELGITHKILASGTAAYDVMWMREPALYQSRGNKETRNVPDITFIYGHDKGFPDERIPSNVVRLDNRVGKGNMDSCGEKNIAYVSNDPV